MASETPTLFQVINELMDARLVDMHTALPAKIISYDAAAQTASVQPLIKRKYADGRFVEIPVINTVPVVFPRGGGFFVSVPLKPGDEVLLVFSERCTEVWKEKGGVVDPTDPRKFHYSDGFAIAGVSSKPKRVTNAAADKMVIAREDGTAEIHVKENGEISLKAVGLLLGEHALAEFVAIASRVESRLSAIETFLGAHSHSGVTTGPGVSGPPSPGFVPDTSVVASSKVKISV